MWNNTLSSWVFPTMKTLDPKKAENKAEKAAVNGSAEAATVSAPSVQINLPLYTKFTPIGAKNGAETKKSHNFEFHTAPEKLHLLRSFFHFS